VIEGDGAIDGEEFEEHCNEVLEAIANYSPQKYTLFKPARSGFCSRKLPGILNDRGNGLA
jgi:hypothetical protein